MRTTPRRRRNVGTFDLDAHRVQGWRREIVPAGPHQTESGGMAVNVPARRPTSGRSRGSSGMSTFVRTTETASARGTGARGSGSTSPNVLVSEPDVALGTSVRSERHLLDGAGPTALGALDVCNDHTRATMPRGLNPPTTGWSSQTRERLHRPRVVHSPDFGGRGIRGRHEPPLACT